jgi:hypothetical protein
MFETPVCPTDGDDAQWVQSMEYSGEYVEEAVDEAFESTTPAWRLRVRN